MYVLRGTIAWRALLKEFPPWQTVFYHFRRMRLSGIWKRVNTALRQQYRVQIGRTADPHATVIDSQSAKTTEVGDQRGFDGNKKIKDRKRHLLVDTLGRLLKVVVHPASLQDRQGGRLLVEAIKGELPTLNKIWADQGYTGAFRTWANAPL